MKKKESNPYLKDGRLADVIAGITALGTYKFYKLDFKAWATRISGPSKSAGYWQTLFEEHPEFFRVNSGEDKASLVWRRQYPKNYHVDEIKEAPPDGHSSGASADRISRKPLEPGEITALVQVAINLHDRALEQSKAKWWWLPLASGLLSFAGASVGALLTLQ